MNNFIIDHGEKVIGIIAVILLTGLTIAFIQSVENEQRLIKQCMADGRKEYECVSLIKNNNHSSAVIVPIIRR